MTKRACRREPFSVQRVMRSVCVCVCVCVCVAARGTGAQHQHRRRKGQVDQEQRGSRIFPDFHFMIANEGSVPMFAVRLSRSGSNYSDSSFEQKGDRIGSEFLCEVHQENRASRDSSTSATTNHQYRHSKMQQHDHCHLWNQFLNRVQSVTFNQTGQSKEACES